MSRKRAALWRLIAVFVLGVGRIHASPQGTAFTYQGRLMDGGLPANGAYDLRFSLFDSSTNGNQLTPFLTNTAVQVTNGIFLTSLDFGAGPFSTNALWLSIGARSNGVPGHFSPLFPLQPVTPVPFALYAPGGTMTPNSNSTLTISNLTVVGPINAGSLSGNGAGITNLNAANITTGTLPVANGGRAGGGVQLLNDDLATGPPPLTSSNLGVSPDGILYWANPSGGWRGTFGFTNLNIYGGTLTFVTNSAFTPNPFDIVMQVPDNLYVHFGNNPSGGMGMWWNPAHSPDGEFQFTSAGRISLLAGYDRLRQAAIQIGAPGSSAYNYFAANKASTTSSDPLGNSLNEAFQTPYVRGADPTAAYWPAFRAEARNTNNDANSWAIVFYDGINLNSYWSELPGTVAGLAILKNGTEQHGKIVTDLLPVTAAATYGLSFDDAENTELTMTGALTITNVSAFYPRTNQLTERNVYLYPGNVARTITLPTAWVWESANGTVKAPSTVPASNIMHLKVWQSIGRMTNYISSYTLIPYTP